MIEFCVFITVEVSVTFKYTIRFTKRNILFQIFIYLNQNLCKYSMFTKIIYEEHQENIYSKNNYELEKCKGRIKVKNWGI